jgi:hypothetical protein
MMRMALIFGATDARKCGATKGATRPRPLSINMVAMQENPAGSTLLPVA